MADREQNAEGAETAHRRMQALVQIANRLGRALDAKAVARAVLDGLVEVVGARRCVMYEDVPGAETLGLLGTRGFDRERPAGYDRLPRSAELPLAEAVRTRRTVWLCDQAALVRAFPRVVEAAGVMPDLQAVAALPLLAADRCLGGLAFSFDAPQAFDDAERAFLVAAAEQCAQALDRARLFEEHRQARALAEAQEQHLRKLQTITVALAGATSMREVAELLVREGRAAIGAPHAAFAQTGSDGVLRLLVCSRGVEALAGPFELAPGGPLELAHRTGRMLEVQLSELAAAEPALAGASWALCTVVPGEPGVTGVLGFGFDRQEGVSARERELATDLSNLAALAMARVRHVEAEGETRRQAEIALTRAQDAERRKDEFLAMLGHELRNPLAPISTAVQLLKARDPEGSSRELRVIERQVNHLSRLVDDLLDVSRITRGNVELHLQHIPLTRPLGKAVEQATPLLERKSQRLSLDVSDEELSLEADPDRLAQVFVNLLSNASKYSPSGSRIHVRVQRVGRNLLVAVRDQGIGIPPELLPHVFDLFVQAPQAIARSQGGLGLGLTIVKKLVSMHGGTVEARSGGEGRGSEFIVTLPQGEPGVRAPVEAGLAEATPGELAGGLRVLVVDDNEDAAALLADALGDEGYTVRAAFDGPSALEEAAEFAPDVAILDIGLPVMDGYELAQRLTERGPRPKLMIALTGYGQPGDRTRALAVGFDEHLVKPANLERIFELLKGVQRAGRAAAGVGPS